MSNELNETVIRITDDPERKDGVLIRHNLPDCNQVDGATLTPAQRAGALIMRNVSSMIEVAQAGPADRQSTTQATQRHLAKQLARKKVNKRSATHKRRG